MSQPKVVDESLPRALSTNPALLRAAVAGLLCLAVAGCKSDDDPAAGPAEITSSEIVQGLTEADFTTKCDARGGTVEVMPHCGGFATAKGFSYDETTSELSEHSCKGANTCAGWNCAIPG